MRPECQPLCSGASPGAASAPDDVVDLDDLRGTLELDAVLTQNRHQTGSEGLELLLGIPDLAHAEVASRAERDMQLEPVRRELARSLDLGLRLVVLLGGQARRASEANKDAHGVSSRWGAAAT